MLIFDTLSELESYQGICPEIAAIITVMDRSLPYEEGPGRYEIPEHKEIKYLIDTAMTSDKGFEAPLNEGRKVMEIVLEGEELVALSGSVIKLAPGRFALYEGGIKAKRGVAPALPGFFKAVRFVF